MGFASVPAERREKRQRVLNAAQIGCGERILVQMTQHPAIGFAELCVHRRLKEIVLNQAADQSGFGIGVLHGDCPPLQSSNNKRWHHTTRYCTGLFAI